MFAYCVRVSGTRRLNDFSQKKKKVVVIIIAYAAAVFGKIETRDHHRPRHEGERHAATHSNEFESRARYTKMIICKNRSFFFFVS